MSNECGGLHCLSKTSGIQASFKGNSSFGFTLIELMLVVAIVGTLCGIAVPAYSGYMERINSSKGVVDIQNIDLCIEKYYAEKGRYPDSLAEIGKDGLKDPWGQPYEYLRLPADEQKRKTVGKFLMEDKPLNSDYDLWSIGKDGKTHRGVNTKKAQDDILRLYNGAFIGLGKDAS